MPYKRQSLSTFDDSFNEIVDYLSEIAPSISLRFIDELEHQVTALSDSPYMYPLYEYDVRFRKMPMNDWKYVVFYTVYEQKREILLYDIMHMSRNIPAYWKSRIKQLLLL